MDVKFPLFIIFLIGCTALSTGNMQAMQITGTAALQPADIQPEKIQAMDMQSEDPRMAIVQSEQPADETVRQSTGWNNKEAAVVLTYDDALNVHLDNVVPVLDENGFQGTFYVTINFPGFTARVDDWSKITNNGHELANHTLFHPCIGQGRDFVEDDYNLSNYSVERIIDETIVTNQVLELMDGKTSGRTFAYPCGNMTVREGESYTGALEPHFIAARSVQSRIESLEEVDLYNVGSYVINGHTAEQMIAIVENALETKGLVTFLFHGVGGEHSYNVALDEHNALINFLKENEDRIWVTTMAEAAHYVIDNR